MPEGTGIRTAFDRACAARRLQPRIALQASAADAIADLAGRGLGVGILTESMAAAYRDRLTARPIADADCPAVLALVWGATQNPARDRLVHHCRVAFGTG
jgi:DNA-binding transcriptional LysR family regulator